jgi:hypothetical protein
LKCDLRNEVNICYNRRPTNHRNEVYLYPVVPGNLQTIITGTKVNITTVTLTSEALRVLIHRAFHGAPPFHLVFLENTIKALKLSWLASGRAADWVMCTWYLQIAVVEAGWRLLSANNLLGTSFGLD